MPVLSVVKTINQRFFITFLIMQTCLMLVFFSGGYYYLLISGNQEAREKATNVAGVFESLGRFGDVRYSKFVVTSLGKSVGLTAFQIFDNRGNEIQGNPFALNDKPIPVSVLSASSGMNESVKILSEELSFAKREFIIGVKVNSGSLLFLKLTLERSQHLLISTMLLSVLGILATAFATYLLVARFSRGIGAKIDDFSNAVRNARVDNINLPKPVFQELAPVSSAFEELLYRFRKQEQESALGRMSVQLCHDLKSPLIGVEIAAGSRTWEEFQQKKPALESAINKLYSMIDSLKRSDIDSLVKPVIAEFIPDILLGTSRSSCELRKIPLEFTYDNLTPNETQLKLDIDKVERAIANIVLNGVEGEAKLIQINLHAVKNDLVIRISNNGVPVPAEVLPKLFQRGVTFGKSGGTGLGLAFVDSITKGHGGNVRHESINGITSFIMTFPGALITAQLNIGIESPNENKSMFNTQQSVLLEQKIGLMLGDTEFANSLKAEILIQSHNVNVEVLDRINLCSVLCCTDPELAMEARLQGSHVVLAVEQSNVHELAKRLLTLIQRNNA